MIIQFESSEATDPLLRDDVGWMKISRMALNAARLKIASRLLHRLQAKTLNGSWTLPCPAPSCPKMKPQPERRPCESGGGQAARLSRGAAEASQVLGSSRLHERPTRSGRF